MTLKYRNAFLLLFALSLPVYAKGNPEAQTCRPPADIKLSQFIIGYGSLMKEESKREDSANVGDNIPIYVTGFERGWIEHSTDPRFGTTYLGVKAKPDVTMNAVYFKLKVSADLFNYDKRENTYCRVNVPKEKIQSLTKDPLPEGQYWIYTTLADNALPSTQYPLVQSYVDIFLSGCFELEKKYKLHDFAKGCVKTTGNWSGSWVNDRVHPRTAVDDVPYVAEVDSLISDTLPQYYNSIKIE
ncbi:hypothetical protein [Legionella fallonii]|uniref:Gamma-glutamylcyclotransferase AIG2-like domain-containing protein n=1 Tax=Legionella fallonii LLAP-10 TaxID=1212491 RepID=A0A098G9N4_9GAMM|nr:hypothetical protein [Legionella fallonii]CEG58697.1 conserved exported protein of unknown function [Legionella fallonii LLAP-10]